MQNSPFLLSCDWGTSSFRLRYVEVATGRIEAEVTSSEGIATIFGAFQQGVQQKGTKPENRIDFYREYLSSQIQLLASKLSVSLSGAPVLISGMASSSIGMQELPYAQLPFPVDGTGVHLFHLPSQDTFPHDILLISGVKSEEDVMRGEETQLIGLAGTFKPEEAIYIFPGTHSKHMYVQNQQMTAFKTYMTGEVFGAISSHTILQNSIEKPAEDNFDTYSSVFAEGVTAARRKGNLLHSLFAVRTQDLFKKFTRQQNYYFLSGLLIGQELLDLQKQPDTSILICCATNLLPYYATAIESLSYTARTRIVLADIIDRIVVQGQLQILRKSTY